MAEQKYEIEINKIHKLLELMTKNKTIELNKEYYVPQWSYNPHIDGYFVYPEFIKSHILVNGIDVYFTNTNYRIYLKEDIYKNIEDAKEMSRWKDSFCYDYAAKISRENLVRHLLNHTTSLNNIKWFLK